uniref:PR domain containing 2, with ZNF domain b n=1 Tax=Labrus bergylta TaxID=56723 RepID=A0A3Q3GEG8_9LABR
LFDYKTLTDCCFKKNSELEVDPDLDLDPDPDGDLEVDHHGESYPCQHCERRFSTRQGLERHNHIHAITNQQTQLFKCRYCSKSFGSQVGRRRHERRHESGPKKRPGSLMQRKELGLHVDRPFMLDENGESKELHPCKYCNKAFGTHTNMRRHQRRIHERHLLPKGVRRKGMLLQEASAQQQPDESPNTSPPPVYVPSADTEDEVDRDDYVVDISKNISENLSFYIDGKIVSTSTVSSCEVIEVDSRSAALLGLDTVIISPNQISQALKVEGRTSAAKQVSNIGQPAGKRRTSTPPLVPNLKVETETSSFTKTVYLSPKLKQLLQTQDIQKSTITLITESHRLASPLSVTPLPGVSGRFKRRTASPPSSPQLSPACKTESCKAEVTSSFTLKVPKLESRSASPPGSLMDKEDGDSLSLTGNNIHSQTSSSGGNSCNQQPLDLSNSVSRKSDSSNKVLGDSALDLSVHRKSSVEPELKGSLAPQPLIKKKKPNTSMLEKVLMNEYVGLTLPAEDGTSTLSNISCVNSPSSNVVSESPEPSSSSSPLCPAPRDPSPPPISPSLPLVKIKAEPQYSIDELPVLNHATQDVADSSPKPAVPDKPSDKTSEGEEVDVTFCKTFVCNVCLEPFNSIKELSGHISEHAADWPFKCEFCLQLFGDTPALLAHRTALHGVGKIFVCSVCSKEFAFLCNLQQHQKDLHPNETCSHTTVESGKLRPQNYTDPSRAKEESCPSTPAPEATDEAAPQNDDSDLDPNEELYTTIKIMASEGGKPKGPDVRLGINQHYPSYKPPPFPYHSRSHAGSVASATNFTTHNIPQTFSTAIRCTKCGNSFDNMPELHKHILACANASDKKRYTPKKNPIPLKQIVKSPNGVVSPLAATVGHSAFRRMGQPKRLNFNQDTGKTKMSALSKKKNQLVQKAISQRNKAATSAKKAVIKVEEEPASNVCPHCSREFTYPASLSKHMAISCPKKPVVKKGKKGAAEVKKEAVSVVDKNMNLRKKASDCEILQIVPESKPLGKTRARSSGAAEPESTQTSKGKTAATQGRQKRPASFPAPVPASKKTKKGQVQSLPPTPTAPETPSDTAPQRPAMRMQRVGKEAAPKRLAEAKTPTTQQLKKEVRLPPRTRERVGGPVTRSLQMASTAPSADVKTEEPPIQEPKETQVRL